jgi:ribosomal protein S18 acetylase RimI-like enzyme
MSLTFSFHVREAVTEDIPSIFLLIQELALFEKAPHEVVNTPEKLLRDGFLTATPLFSAHVAESEAGEIIGFTLCYIRYSTWKGPVLYLEDLYVKEKYRGNGVGKALFENCLLLAKQREYKRITWQVLDWNTSAIDFYKQWDVKLDPEWINGSIDL